MSNVLSVSNVLSLSNGLSVSNVLSLSNGLSLSNVLSLSNGLSLNDVLSLSRVVVGLAGTKKACGQGGCGACTVMVSRINRMQNNILYP